MGNGRDSGGLLRSCLTVSNDTRVRAEGFVKIIAMLISRKGLKFASRA